MNRRAFWSRLRVVFKLARISGLASATTRTLVKTASFDVLRIVVPAGKEIPTHRAKGEIVVQCLEGKIAFTACGKTHDLEAGHLLYLPAGEPHSYSLRASRTVRYCSPFSCRVADSSDQRHVASEDTNVCNTGNDVNLVGHHVRNGPSSGAKFKDCLPASTSQASIACVNASRAVWLGGNFSSPAGFIRQPPSFRFCA